MMKAIKILFGTVVVAAAIYVIVVLGIVRLVMPVGMVLSERQAAPTVATQPSYVVRVTAEGRTPIAGSGFLVRNDVVLTAYRNVKRVNRRTIQVEFMDGYKCEATIIKAHPFWDLALLRIKPVLYPEARPAMVPAAKGETVTVCGFPIGLRYGEVSGEVVGRRTRAQDIDSLFLVNNQALPGMVGGPVIDTNGDVVGIMYAANLYISVTDIDIVKRFLATEN